MASVERVSFHWPGRHNFCALLRNRPAVVDAAIHRVDNDANRLFETRAGMSGDQSDV